MVRVVMFFIFLSNETLAISKIKDGYIEQLSENYEEEIRNHQVWVEEEIEIPVELLNAIQQNNRFDINNNQEFNEMPSLGQSPRITRN